MRVHTIAIAGCGPAGLSAALLLSRLGHRVTLFDQFDTPRPIGSGLMLQPTGLAVLDALGLGERMRRLGQPVSRLLGKTIPTGRTALDVSFPDPAWRPLAVHRGGLFNVLFDAVSDRGIAIETGFEIADVERRSQGVRLIAGNGRASACFDCIVDATGAGSPLARRAAAPFARRSLPYGALWASLEGPFDGVDTGILEQRYRHASIMIGILPVGRTGEDGAARVTLFWSLRSDDYQRWRNTDIRRWHDDVARLWPLAGRLARRIDDHDAMTYARYGHHTMALPFGERIVFIGDAAHSTSPQLGQGANMALLDAAALAAAFAGNCDPAQAFARYAARRRFHVRFYQAMSAVFTPFYQSDSRLLPLVRDAGFTIVNHLPGGPGLFRRLVTGAFARPLAGLFTGGDP